ncbi:MAG: FprA family A-type flavoprotein [Pseudomonadota bacterium]
MADEGPVRVAYGVDSIGALDRDLRTFDVILKSSNGTSDIAYAVRGSAGLAVVDTVKQEFADVFFRTLEQLAADEEITALVLNHLEPEHTGAVPEFLRRAPIATVCVSLCGLQVLGELLKDEFERFDIRPLKTGDTLSLGNRTLELFITPYVYWPETQCTYPEGAGLPFTCDLLGCQFCDARLFNDLVGDFRFSLEHCFVHITRPFTPYVTDAFDLIEPLEIDMVAPAHGPVLRAHPHSYVEHYRRLVTSRLASEAGAEKTLLNFYVSAYGARDEMTQAVYEGASEAEGVRLSLVELQGGEVTPFVDPIEEADGLVLGPPTINGDAARTLWDLLASLVDIDTKGKLAAAIGFSVWEGEAVPMVQARLRGVTMRVREAGIRVKLHPTKAELEACCAFGRCLAGHPTGAIAPRESDLADLIAS